MTHDDPKVGPIENVDGAKSESRADRQLEALLEQLEIEKAPSSLTRRLRRIPREEEGRNAGWWSVLSPPQVPRWMLVPAVAAALLAVGVVLMMPRQPSQEEVLQARHDVAVAFSYIDEAGILTGEEIESVLGGELRHTIKDNLSKHIPFTEQSRKEETT